MAQTVILPLADREQRMSGRPATALDSDLAELIEEGTLVVPSTVKKFASCDKQSYLNTVMSYPYLDEASHTWVEVPVALLQTQDIPDDILQLIPGPLVGALRAFRERKE